MSSTTDTLDYGALVTQWQPGGNRNTGYQRWLWACLIVALLIAVTLSLVDVPEPERTTRADIPERVARFMVEQPKPPPEPAPKPERKPQPIPVVEPEPLVERERPPRENREPVTEAQKAAREEAQQSGLLAMGDKLDGLMDTSGVDTMLGTESSGGAGLGSSAAGYGDGDLASASARTQATGVDANTVSVEGNALARREIAKVQAPESTASPSDGQEGRTQEGFANTGRTDEEVSLVFDRNKGMLYSLYNRARRSTPGLQGRLVVEVTISPSGQVTAVEIVSSELNAPSLEQRIRARILQFQFEQKQAETITIIYPIDFLPS